MPKNVILAASLPAAPDKLFDMYLDAESHAAITGAPVIIEPRAGAPFRAFNGMLSGMILHVEPKRLIVQTWRSANWPLPTARQMRQSVISELRSISIRTSPPPMAMSAGHFTMSSWKGSVLP